MMPLPCSYSILRTIKEQPDMLVLSGAPSLLNPPVFDGAHVGAWTCFSGHVDLSSGSVPVRTVKICLKQISLML